MVNVGQAVRLKIDIALNAELPGLVLGYVIKDRLGQPMYGTNTHHLGIDLNSRVQHNRVSVMFCFPANLGPGSYSIATALHTSDTHLAANYEWRDLAFVFKVLNINRTPFEGQCWIPPKVEFAA